MREAVILLGVTLAFLGLPLAASAATVDYTLTCVSGDTICQHFYDNGTITFSLPQFPVPDSTDPPRFFTFNSVPANINGNSATLTRLSFWAAPYSPGLTFNAPANEFGQGELYLSVCNYTRVH